LDPTDYSVFQAVFGAILSVIIALEFKRSLLISVERQQSVVQVHTVILIALLAIVRKVLILDVTKATNELFALAAAILALGGVLVSERSGPEHRWRRLCAATQSCSARWTRKENFYGEIAMQERKVRQAPNLFSPAAVGPLKLNNRVVMAPLTRSRARPGKCRLS
jgi:Phosphate-starvation-inducible E family